MIWAILALLGIPLWLIAIFLFILLRSRSAVKKIPGSFACRVRAPCDEVGGLRGQFPRYDDRAHWVHKVLVVHGGNPFLIVTTPLGVVETQGQPELPDPMEEKHLKRVEDPVMLRYRLDSGALIELVCTKADVDRALGPFPAATPAA
jgi:hypothetical protein